MNQGVQWYIDLSEAEQGQVTTFSILLEEDIYIYENLADFLNGCRMKICDLLDKTGCGYDFTAHPYFCQQRDKLLK